MRPLALLLVGSLLIPAADAADCPGDPGYTLSITPDVVPVGGAFQYAVTAPADSIVVVFVSASPGPTMTPWGPFCLGLPATYLVGFLPTGEVVRFIPIQCDPAFVGAVGHFQYIAQAPDGQIARSNGQTLTVVAGSCLGVTINPGDYATFTQGGWGTSCSGNNPGCIRDQWFPTVYPNGVTIGDLDGIDGDGHYALHFTTSAAVQAFVPAGGPGKALDADATDPTSSAAGVFAGQLLAAKLNVDFDASGAFDAIKQQTGVPLGSLVYVDQVHPKLLGKTVASVLTLAERTLSGELTPPVDVDGDTVGDVSISDLITALDRLNNEFDDGDQALGALGLP